MFFPLRDDNPTHAAPIVTGLLLVANAAAFAFQIFGPLDPQALVEAYGLVPGRFDAGAANALGPPWPTLISSMFLHGDLFHLGGNLLYLWIFGNNVEDLLGRAKFLFFYLACGIVAGLSHVLVNPASTVPTVGASGAVAGVLGAYLVAYPRARVLTAVFILFFIRLVEVPAAILLVFWFVMQSFQGFLSLGVRELSGGVAWFAHIGGFVAGVVGIRVLARDGLRALRASRIG